MTGSPGARCAGTRWQPAQVEVPSVLGAVFWGRLAASEHAAAARLSLIADIMVSLGAPVSLALRLRNAVVVKQQQSARALPLASMFGGALARPIAGFVVGRPPANLPALIRELTIEGALGHGYVTRYAELAAWMCTRRPLSTAWSALATDEARNVETIWAAVTWLVQTHRAVAEPALRAAMRAVSDLEAPKTVPWWLEGHDRRSVGVLPRHSEVELFGLSRSTVEDRVDALIGLRRLAPGISGLSPAETGG